MIRCYYIRTVAEPRKILVWYHDQAAWYCRGIPTLFPTPGDAERILRRLPDEQRAAAEIVAGFLGDYADAPADIQ